ncbi:MAG TPA: FHA domain-containing protein, partial [Anaerolineaceae bacterium]|nr:FHA domain-containing protein [Anaerolineaceae bacterium]
MEHSGAELPILIGQSGPLNGQRWAISVAMTVGRDADCDIVIPDRQVSRVHARLTPAEAGVLLEDLASKNGTYCNGERIESNIILQDGDLIQVALVQHFVFLSSDATMPLGGEIPIRHPAGSRRLYLDTLSRRVWIGEEEVLPPLSVPQFRLLQALYEQPGKVVPR